MATPKGWTRKGTGWYAHDNLGSIVIEYAGASVSVWWWYPAYAEDEVKHRQGPYPTLREAARAAELKKKLVKLAGGQSTPPHEGHNV